MNAEVGEPTVASVLVLEDDGALGEVLGLILREQGYVASIAAHARSAHAACEQQEPDVILVDLDVPRMGGFDFLREHRRAHECRARSVILTSLGYTANDLRNLRVDAAVPKPFRLDDFLAAIESTR